MDNQKLHLVDGLTLSSVTDSFEYEDQAYRLASANDYDKTTEFGPEISSSISCTSKIFLAEANKAGNFKAKVPANYAFLDRTLINPSIDCVVSTAMDK